MNKILFSADPDINYVFHMLSVSKCGYDNAYGEKYRGRYDPADLKIIRAEEARLTVRGGEHCGTWYGPMVCGPARSGMTARDYYMQTIAWIEGGNLDLPREELDAAVDVCRVMTGYYEDFMADIWPAERARLEEYIRPLREIFDHNGFTERAEAAVGVIMPPPFFTAALVTGVDGGAEAIDLTEDRDVFGIGRGADAEAAFISHEFIIYLLKAALKDESGFGSRDTWALTEGLAEYYLGKAAGGARSFQACQAQAEAYRRLEGTCGTDAVRLYRAALDEMRRRK